MSMIMHVSERLHNCFAMVFVVFTVLVLLSSCRINIVELQPEYDIVTTTYYNSTVYGYRPQYSIDKENHHICSEGLRWRTNDYLKFDLSSNKLLDSVNIDINPYHAVYDAAFINKDSIIITQSTSLCDGNHDNCILLIDRKNNVLDTLSTILSDAPVAMRSKQEIPLGDRYYVSLANNPICYANGMLYLSLKPSDWDNKTCQNRDSLGGILVHIPKKEFVRLPIRSEKLPDDGYFWSPFQLESKGLACGDYIFSFLASSPVVYRYDTKSRCLKHRKMKMVSINTIEPYKKGERYHQYDPFKSEFVDMYWDSIRDQIIRVARIACDSISDGPITTQYVNYSYSFSIFDLNLHKKAEGIVPEGYSPTFIPYKDGYLLYKIKSKPEAYTYYTCKYRKGTKQDLLKPVVEKRNRLNRLAPKMSKEMAFTRYVHQMTGKDSLKYQNFIIIPETSCPTCVPVYGDIIRNNKDRLIANKTAVILISADSTVINEFKYLIDEPLSCNAASLVYADSEDLFRRYIEEWVNLRYIEFDNRGHLVTDMIVDPKDLSIFNKMLKR